MAINIETSKKYQNALSELLKYDVGRNAYFDVQIPKLSYLFQAKYSSEPFVYLCHSAELPGETTKTVSQKIYGTVEQFPVMTAYKDITLSFYTRGVDVDDIRSFFLEWITYTTGRELLLWKPHKTSYNVPYKDDIVTDIIVNQYDLVGSKLNSYTLLRAFPVVISETPLGWSLGNKAISLDVTFSFTEYSFNNNDPGSTIQENRSLRGLNFSIQDSKVSITSEFNQNIVQKSIDSYLLTNFTFK